jgi:hypothetical protein
MLVLGSLFIVGQRIRMADGSFVKIPSEIGGSAVDPRYWTVPKRKMSPDIDHRGNAFGWYRDTIGCKIIEGLLVAGVQCLSS